MATCPKKWDHLILPEQTYAAVARVPHYQLSTLPSTPSCYTKPGNCSDGVPPHEKRDTSRRRSLARSRVPTSQTPRPRGLRNRRDHDPSRVECHRRHPAASGRQGPRLPPLRCQQAAEPRAIPHAVSRPPLVAAGSTGPAIPATRAGPVGRMSTTATTSRNVTAACSTGTSPTTRTAPRAKAKIPSSPSGGSARRSGATRTLMTTSIRLREGWR